MASAIIAHGVLTYNTNRYKLLYNFDKHYRVAFDTNTGELYTHRWALGTYYNHYNFLDRVKTKIKEEKENCKDKAK